MSQPLYNIVIHCSETSPLFWKNRQIQCASRSNSVQSATVETFHFEDENNNPIYRVAYVAFETEAAAEMHLNVLSSMTEGGIIVDTDFRPEIFKHRRKADSGISLKCSNFMLVFGGMTL